MGMIHRFANSTAAQLPTWREEVAIVRETPAFQTPKEHENSVWEKKSGSTPNKISIQCLPQFDRNWLSMSALGRTQPPNTSSEWPTPPSRFWLFHPSLRGGATRCAILRFFRARRPDRSNTRSG